MYNQIRRKENYIYFYSSVAEGVMLFEPIIILTAVVVISVVVVVNSSC